MGTWGTRPFDNDAAADWAGDLDALRPAERDEFLRRTFATFLADTDPDGEIGAEEVVAAAAVVAARLPDGPPLDDGYGPAAATVASLTVDDPVRRSARQALELATSEGGGWSQSWAVVGSLPDALAALQPIRLALQITSSTPSPGSTGPG